MGSPRGVQGYEPAELVTGMILQVGCWVILDVRNWRATAQLRSDNLCNLYILVLANIHCYLYHISRVKHKIPTIYFQDRPAKNQVCQEVMNFVGF